MPPIPQHTRAAEVLARLKSQGNPASVEGQARYGIAPKTVNYGVSLPTLRAMAKEIGKDHDLAEQLWASGVHPARLLATLIDDPRQVTEEQMDRWASTFDSWDLVDGAAGNLFHKTPFAYDKAAQWSAREEEFVKRAAFSLIAYLAVHDKKAPDERFQAFLPLIKREANDNRNLVKKAVNWALRQIGKRNSALNTAAIACAEEIRTLDSSPARWIAADALRELKSEAVQRRLAR
jgi:3-methyladenine DNA glycosylase AlkD